MTLLKNRFCKFSRAADSRSGPDLIRIQEVIAYECFNWKGRHDLTPVLNHNEPPGSLRQLRGGTPSEWTMLLRMQQELLGLIVLISSLPGWLKNLVFDHNFIEHAPYSWLPNTVCIGGSSRFSEINYCVWRRDRQFDRIARHQGLQRYKVIRMQYSWTLCRFFKPTGSMNMPR